MFAQAALTRPPAVFIYFAKQCFAGYLEMVRKVAGRLSGKRFFCPLSGCKVS